MRKVLKYLVPILMCVTITVLILVGRNSFTKSGSDLMLDLCDAFAIPGMIMMCFGALVFATNGGTFDMVAFGFIKLFDLFKRDLTKVKYRTFYDYRQVQKEKKRSYLYLIIIAAVFLAAAVVFLIIFNTYQ